MQESFHEYGIKDTLQIVHKYHRGDNSSSRLQGLLHLIAESTDNTVPIIMT